MPLELFHRAYELACRVWPGPASRVSRHDIARARLFACLDVRESLRLSYCKAEAFLADVSESPEANRVTSCPIRISSSVSQ